MVAETSGVIVGVGVGVSVGVGVAVGSGVWVGVEVWVAVGIGVGVLNMAKLQPDGNKARTKVSETHEASFTVGAFMFPPRDPFWADIVSVIFSRDF